jgi:serine phosphatase RsbU (regulator of sigma subunit)
MAPEQKKSLDLANVKKKLKDYEQLLQDYTLMRTKNKMKDFEVEFLKWREVVKEYFTLELENNIAQHNANEKILRYKLEAYQKKTPNFSYGSLISTEALSQDEETKARPSGIA